MATNEEAGMVEIFVNTRPKNVHHGKISYSELIALAFPGETIPEGANITITYSLPKGNKDGTVIIGSDVEVHKGMVFNVKRTDKS